MIQLTRRDILSHQSLVPWPNQRQVEQDLLLCQSMNALFSDGFLKGQIAMRGGTETLDKMSMRVKHDLDYVKNWSLWLDLKIIFLTVFKGFVNKSAY